MQHFKDVEIAKVRMEEKRRFHQEFDKLKQELERNYEMKAKALIEREKNAIDRLQKQQEVDLAPTLGFLLIFPLLLLDNQLQQIKRVFLRAQND